MVSLLVECTVSMLKILCLMFRDQRITYREFVEHTKVKIDFLNSSNDIIPENFRLVVDDILKECNLEMSHWSEKIPGEKYLNC